jgi:uncharacterized protein DUF945
MKKTLITLGVVILVAAALPIIGNSVMQSSIQERVNELKVYGLESKKIETEKGYLNTKQHFEFLLKDANAFVEYLNKYADGQIPPYVNAMLEGVLIGVDLEYSNIPFSKSVTLDVYPLSMSESMANELQKENLPFYTYLEKFLHSKGILYHIDYNIVSQDFEGFIKDIDEKYTLEDKTELLLSLQGAIYEGNGELIAPERLTTSVKKIRLEILEKNDSVIFNLHDLQTASSYESKSTYLSSTELEDFDFVVSGTKQDLTVHLKDIKLNASSNTQGEFAEIDSKSSIENLQLDSEKLTLDMKNFNIDMAIDSLDKESFQESVEMFSKLNKLNDPTLELKLRESLIKMLSKGLVFSIADFSIEDITLKKSEKLKGFKVQSQMKIKEDKDFAQKLQASPLLLISNIDVVTKIRVSREIYAKLTEQRPVPQMIQGYLKEDGNDYIFDFNFQKGQLTLNGKALQ